MASHVIVPVMSGSLVNYPMPAGVPPVPIAVLQSCNGPADLLSLWNKITRDLSPFTQVLDIPEDDLITFHITFDHGAMAYLAHRFMHEHVHKDVMFVLDAKNTDHIYLGPIEEFTQNTRALAFLPNNSPSARDQLPLFFSDLQSSMNRIRKLGSDKMAKKTPKIPRPPNAYILYRKDNHERIKTENPGITNNEISQVLGRAWVAEPDRVRNHYKQLALVAKEKHLVEYPDYQYRPRRPGEKLRRRRAISKSIPTRPATT